MKCNLECSYCISGIYGGRDNTTQHPPLDQCLQTIDFMFEYADLYMAKRPKGLKHVVLNVYGGESLHHPDIVEILQCLRQRHEKYKSKWNLTVTTTTNAIISERKLASILPLVDEFTVSYHVENSPKNKQLFRDNLLAIKAAGRRQKCVVLMHPEQELFQDCENMIAWLNQNQINVLPRQLDHSVRRTQFNYQQQQVKWFDRLYASKGTHQPIVAESTTTDLANTGRACCGGRNLCANQNYKEKIFFTNNKFPGWFCSVNYFFLYVKQVNGEVFVNKDCKMNFDGTVGPIGTLSDTEAILETARSTTTPVIQCAKERCVCGLCAPKAADLDTYKTIMRKYEIPNPNLL